MGFGRADYAQPATLLPRTCRDGTVAGHSFLPAAALRGFLSGAQRRIRNPAAVDLGVQSSLAQCRDDRRRLGPRSGRLVVAGGLCFPNNPVGELAVSHGVPMIDVPVIGGLRNLGPVGASSRSRLAAAGLVPVFIPLSAAAPVFPPLSAGVPVFPPLSAAVPVFISSGSSVPPYRQHRPPHTPDASICRINCPHR